MQVQNLLMR